MDSITVAAKTEALDSVVDFVEEKLTSCECPMRTLLQLRLAIEEVFVNIASYALLTMMIAQVCGLKPGEFIHTTGDTHIYLNHFEQVKEQLSREPRPLPRMILNPEVKDLYDFVYEDFTLEGYDPWPAIKAPVAV